MASFPSPSEDIVLTHFIVSSDVSRAQAFYSGVLGGEVLRDGESPTDRGVELRCYMRDPDGHLIEVGHNQNAELVTDRRHRDSA